MTWIGLSTPDEVLSALHSAMGILARLNVQVPYSFELSIGGADEPNPVGDSVLRVLREIEKAIEVVELLYPTDDDGNAR